MELLLVLALLASTLSFCRSPAQPTGNVHPEWLTELIQKLESAPVANPPASIYRYEYKGQAVYYLPPRGYDIPSILFDEEGSIICRPDGGVMGVGDGRCTDFFDERENEKLIWKDKRA
jgi:hypothetical protein